MPGPRVPLIGVDPARPSLKLADSLPLSGAQIAYPAEVDDDGGYAQSGVSFLSDVLAEDLELAGHFTATLWVSSTSADMDVYVALRVIGPDGVEVPYAVYARQLQGPGDLGVSQGFSKEARSHPFYN